MTARTRMFNVRSVTTMLLEVVGNWASTLPIPCRDPSLDMSKVHAKWLVSLLRSMANGFGFPVGFPLKQSNTECHPWELDRWKPPFEASHRGPSKRVRIVGLLVVDSNPSFQPSFFHSCFPTRLFDGFLKRSGSLERPPPEFQCLSDHLGKKSPRTWAEIEEAWRSRGFDHPNEPQTSETHRRGNKLSFGQMADSYGKGFAMLQTLKSKDLQDRCDVFLRSAFVSCVC